MTRRVLAALAAMGLLFLLTASAQKPRPTQQLAVYDADGKRLGIVTGGEYAFGQFVPLVPFLVDEVPLMLLVYRDGFFQHSTVAWESSNCSGTPFVISLRSSSSSMPVVAIGLPGNTVYIENGPAKTVNIRSYSTAPVGWLDYPPLQRSACAPWEGLQPGASQPRQVTIPARPLVDMNTQFKPPFTVR